MKKTVGFAFVSGVYVIKYSHGNILSIWGYVRHWRDWCSRMFRLSWFLLAPVLMNSSMPPLSQPRVSAVPAVRSCRRRCTQKRDVHRLSAARPPVPCRRLSLTDRSQPQRPKQKWDRQIRSRAVTPRQCVLKHLWYLSYLWYSWSLRGFIADEQTLGGNLEKA